MTANLLSRPDPWVALVNAKVARDRSTRSPGLHNFCSYGGTTYTAVSKTVALGRLGLSPSRSTKLESQLIGDQHRLLSGWVQIMDWES